MDSSQRLTKAKTTVDKVPTALRASYNSSQITSPSKKDFSKAMQAKRESGAKETEALKPV